MATPNYGYEKRQRELAKKKKKEEKLRAKTSERRPDQDDHAPQADPSGQQPHQSQQGTAEGGTAASPGTADPARNLQGQAGR